MVSLYAVCTRTAVQRGSCSRLLLPHSPVHRGGLLLTKKVSVYWSEELRDGPCKCYAACVSLLQNSSWVEFVRLYKTWEHCACMSRFNEEEGLLPPTIQFITTRPVVFHLQKQGIITMARLVHLTKHWPKTLSEGRSCKLCQLKKPKLWFPISVLVSGFDDSCTWCCQCVILYCHLSLYQDDGGQLVFLPIVWG